MNKKRLVVHLSGFGEFQGVECNPTEDLVKQIPIYLEAMPIDSRVVLVSTTVFETSAVGALFSLTELLQKHKIALHSNTAAIITEPNDHDKAKDIILFLHLGVNTHQENFCLEKTAWNEATFRCPDERGWKPEGQKINPVDDRNSLTTEISLDIVRDKLISKGFPVVISNDPGRFLCNFIYYASLYFSKINGTESLFVHVPPFGVIESDRQLEFVRSLLDVLAEILLGPL
jgi:pyroglutamyl-peptidase